MLYQRKNPSGWEGEHSAVLAYAWRQPLGQGSIQSEDCSCSDASVLIWAKASLGSRGGDGDAGAVLWQRQASLGASIQCNSTWVVNKACGFITPLPCALCKPMWCLGFSVWYWRSDTIVSALSFLRTQEGGMPPEIKHQQGSGLLSLTWLCLRGNQIIFISPPGAWCHAGPCFSCTRLTPLAFQMYLAHCVLKSISFLLTKRLFCAR